ncbi:hypothetical protein PFISCL1PPCAC_4566 [Pristionchus fissidentatus]|uniref:Symplekin C-terminal domain-containing protein n=1 Tax=Pristionchus fissidentatus TaxID=1538716 RepID=A0AAV5V5X8_9BILA|nr:hypothetical protein PFISCL1PPCAC_4566 [Pristionchus fissidentatus]
MIITNELKIQNSHLKVVILIVEKYPPGLVMKFVVEELERNPFSLPIRLRLASILKTVFFEPKDVHEIRDLVVKYPALAAECYDPIIKLLERKYAYTEHERRLDEQRAVVAQLLTKFSPETDFVETDDEFEIANAQSTSENIFEII